MLKSQFILWVVTLLVAYTGGFVPARGETLTLADCLRETAEHNPTIIGQRLAIERAFATRLTLRARSLPQLSIAGIGGLLNQTDNVVKKQDVTTDGQTRSVTTTTVETTNKPIILGTGNLYQALFDAAIPASYRRGNVETLAAEQNFYSVASQQLHAARLLFNQALYQQESGGIFRRIDASLSANVQSQTQLVAAGLVGRAGLLSAQVQRASFNPNLVTAGGTYRANLASLLQTMGRELPSDKKGDDPLGRITLSGTLDDAARSFDAAEAVRVALERRPDLRALRAMVKGEQEDANIAKAGYYPLIRLYLAGEAVPPNSNVRNRPTAIRQSDQIQTTELRPGVSGSWTIIDPGTTRGAVRAQEASRDTVALSLKALETNLPAQLATVRTRLDDATARIAALRGSVKTAQDTLGIIQGGLAQGINSQTEFLYAQSDVLNIQFSLLAAQLEMTLAHAEFDRLTGNYLRYVDPEPGSRSRRPSAKE